MNAYSYNDNLEYIGITDCQLDPIESQLAHHEVWLLPANATFMPPPEFDLDKEKVIWDGITWNIEQLPEELEESIKFDYTSTEITSGTYIGTGLCGEANPNTISPKTKARILMILQNDETLLTLTRTDLTDEPFTWFKSSAKEQCNENGVVYNWIAVT